MKVIAITVTIAKKYSPNDEIPSLPPNADKIVQDEVNKTHGVEVPEQLFAPERSPSRSPTSRESSNILKESRLHKTQRTKSVGHARRESLKFLRPSMLNNTGKESNTNDNGGPLDATGYLEYHGNKSEDGTSYPIESADNNEPQLLTDNEILREAAKAPPGTMPSIDYPRSLFLKGFFSVQTTSSKPLPIVRYKIIYVLKKFGIKFKEVKGGFICIREMSFRKNSSNETSPTIIESNSNNSNNSKEINKSHFPGDPDYSLTQQKRSGSKKSPLSKDTASFGTDSIDMGPENISPVEGSINDSVVITPQVQNISENKSLTSLGYGFDGLTSAEDKHLLKFEIHIVRVRIVGLAGVHFKKVSGNSWTYKETASLILKELNL